MTSCSVKRFVYNNGLGSKQTGIDSNEYFRKFWNISVTFCWQWNILSWDVSFMVTWKVRTFWLVVMVGLRSAILGFPSVLYIQSKRMLSVRQPYVVLQRNNREHISISASQVTAPHCIQRRKPFSTKPSTHSHQMCGHSVAFSTNFVCYIIRSIGLMTSMNCFSYHRDPSIRRLTMNARITRGIWWDCLI